MELCMPRAQLLDLTAPDGSINQPNSYLTAFTLGDGVP